MRIALAVLRWLAAGAASLNPLSVADPAEHAEGDREAVTR